MDFKEVLLMKMITAIAAVIMIPTLISGIYGINFGHIPYSDYIYGFYAVLGLMLFTIVGLVLYFKRLKWL